NFKVSRLWGKKHYRIGVNPIVFDYKIPASALKAIMVHELQHTYDYHRRGIIPVAIQLLMREHRYRYRYERRTDVQTLLRGHGLGLAQFRRWQYQFLNDRALEVKKKNYLTDQEIEFLVANLETKKERIKRSLSGY